MLTTVHQRVLVDGEIPDDAGYPGGLLSPPHLLTAKGEQLGHHDKHSDGYDGPMTL